MGRRDAFSVPEVFTQKHSLTSQRTRQREISLLPVRT
jgi:hypothetical protein